MKILIVGGSVVGASAALFLAARGVTPVLVEKHVSVSTRLRAKVFYPRSMEAYRAVGADQDIYAIQHAAPPADHAAVVESLAGPELQRWLLPAAQDFSAVSPCQSALVKQTDLELVVRAHAQAAGADLRFGHRLLDLLAKNDRVVARIEGPEGQYELDADYVLAADGNASAVRESLGIERCGRDRISSAIEIGFQADLRPLLDGRRLAMAWTAPPERLFLSWATGMDRGAVSLRTDAEHLGDQPCQDMVARALGLPPSQFRITGHQAWHISAWVAGSYRRGRIFLLGDAAHVAPPTGGFGANAGIQDAWNLTSKFVSIARGYAGPRLLDDYEPERHAVGRLTVDQALLRLDGGTEMLSEAAVAVGYRYPTPDEDVSLPEADEPGRWHGEPGTRVPHVWLPDGRSTLDLIHDGRYALLTGSATDVRSPGPGVDVVAVPELLGKHGTLLVRPDHVVQGPDTR
jgi:2-polyprenyl-6-methoxyphenol hydroxylase-like FAD-dependent oxidoreductase